MKIRSFLFAGIAVLGCLTGCNPSGNEEVAHTFEISGLDENSLAYTSDGGMKQFTLKTDISWTANSDVDWLTITPGSGEASSLTTTKVRVKAGTNPVSEDRKAIITLVAADESIDIDPIIINVTQEKGLTFSFSNETEEHAYTDADLKVVPNGGSSDSYWFYTCTSASTFEEYGVDELVSQRISYLNSYLSSYSVSDFCYTGTDTVSFYGLVSETEYVLIAFGIKKSSKFEATTSGFSFSFTTDAAPAADEDYLDFIGTYSIDLIDYFESETDDDGNITEITRASVNMVVEQEYINESYYFYFPDDNFTPVDGDYVDTFSAAYDETAKTISLINNQYGSMGYIWNFGSPVGTGWMAFTAGWWNDEVSEVESVDFTLSDDKKTLKLANESTVADDQLYIQGLICDKNGDATDYAYAIYIFDEKSIPTRVDEAAATAVSADKLVINAKSDKVRNLKANGKIHKTVIR